MNPIEEQEVVEALGKIKMKKAVGTNDKPADVWKYSVMQVSSG